MMILEKVPTSLRGELSRWLIEPKTGVFLGNPSARVRDELWNRAVVKSREGSVLQIWTDNSPQGYKSRTLGSASRSLVDHEGVTLVQLPPKPDKKQIQTPSLPNPSDTSDNPVKPFDNPIE